MLKPYHTFLIFCVLLNSCISKYNLDVGSNANVLFVEGNLNNLDSAQYIQLKINLKSDKEVLFVNVADAKVDIVHQGSEIIHCKYADQGKYILPTDFKVKIGDSYKLIFELSDGSKYESEEEKVISSAKIDNVYGIYQKTGLLYNGLKLPGHKIYLDFSADQMATQYVLWQWKWFEKIDFCATCSGSKFYLNNSANGGSCIASNNTLRSTFDYFCNGNCWDVYYSDNINIMQSGLTSGNQINGKEIAQIPFLQYRGALIQIYQYSISKAAYNYLSLIQNQSENNGTLTDTPPASFIGNIKSLSNTSQIVAGNFMVSAKSVNNYWINRDSVNFEGTPYGVLNGRYPNPEPMEMDLKRPPLAPCIESKNRTSHKPQGWIK